MSIQKIVVWTLSAVALGATGFMVWKKTTENKAEDSIAKEDKERREGGNGGNLALQNQLLNLEDPVTFDNLLESGLTLSVGQGKHLSIEENLTTGFEWHVKPNECLDHLEVLETYDAPVTLENEEALMGAPGDKYYTLIGSTEGSCEFTIAYARSWEFDWGDRIGAADEIF